MDFGKLDIGEQVKERLRAAVNSGSLSHAVLFTGADADTRKKTARRVAAALLCTSAGERPCGKCPACVKTKAGTHPDMPEIEGTDKQKSIKIDTVRDLRRQAFIVPNEAENRVVLILEASAMGEEAQNALLKLIEEPPRFTRFLLTCDSREQLLSTVQSRVTTYALGGGGGGRTSAKAAEKLETVTLGLLSSLANGSEFDLILATAPLEKDRALFLKCVNALIELLHDARRRADGLPPLKDDAGREEAARAARRLDAHRLPQYIEVLKALADDAEKNANENLLLARLASELAQVTQKNDQAGHVRFS